MGRCTAWLCCLFLALQIFFTIFEHLVIPHIGWMEGWMVEWMAGCMHSWLHCSFFLPSKNNSTKQKKNSAKEKIGKSRKKASSPLFFGLLLFAKLQTRSHLAFWKKNGTPKKSYWTKKLNCKRITSTHHDCLLRFRRLQKKNPAPLAPSGYVRTF